MIALRKLASAGFFTVCAVSLAATARAQVQPQIPPQGQRPQVQPQVQPGIPQQGMFPGGINQTPWFADPNVRQQLKLNDAQFNRLNQAFNDARTRFQKGINQQLNNNLTEAQRQQRMRDFNQNFFRDFSTTTNSILTDPQQRQRFNQLNWQFHGLAAFQDPTIQQKLNLTAEQTQKLDQFRTDFSRQMNDLNSTFRTDRAGATKQFNQLQTNMNERINTILTSEQQRTWRTMTGDPFTFPPNLFFPGSTTTPNNR